MTDDEINRITFEQWGPVIDVPPAAHRCYEGDEMLTDEELNALRRAAKDDPKVVDTFWHLLYARAIIAAHTAKLLDGVEMPEPWVLRDGKTHETGLFTADQLQQYAATAALNARNKALEEAAVEFEGLYSLGGDDIAKCLRQMKGMV
jgi:hypothetical protein